MKKAVHFGAGNIGRGFIGALFAQSGYHVTFVDIAEQIIEQLNRDKSYQVKTAAQPQKVITVENVSGLNNLQQEQEVIEEIKEATYITTAIGPSILPRIAPLIAKALAERVKSNEEKVYVIACENQISATDILKEHILNALENKEKEAVIQKVSFFNSAVDRIVPIQTEQGSLDVLVEPYYEWVVETSEEIPPVEGMKIVPELAPFIERKLFTVNTGHAVIAYLGYLKGKETIHETLQDSTIHEEVKATLQETGAYLVKAYGLDKEDHSAYIEKIIGRFENPYLNDSVTRVGRSPIRKLGPQDRLVRPAVEAKKAGLSYTHLAKAIAAALLFAPKEDEEAMKLQNLLKEQGIVAVLEQISELNEDGPIMKEIVQHYENLKGE
ncbi:mannitol-1-phosphate 5-dehydrogenase [Priestia endophytica]|uniref:mannitol-1-phosphate 5-dehydrogenase n=1 Tax=Priestia endophytica TaxID=135735 RepID=UPI000DCA77E6|nr:mannitol-1-phosphate 5-dehydrogenase [Priestia endophytica]RAS76551.1 mannitol-1-phosphate 5-dehydrogenase [Priestia endophytica]